MENFIVEKGKQIRFKIIYSTLAWYVRTHSLIMERMAFHNFEVMKFGYDIESMFNSHRKMIVRDCNFTSFSFDGISAFSLFKTKELIHVSGSIFKNFRIHSFDSSSE